MEDILIPLANFILTCVLTYSINRYRQLQNDNKAIRKGVQSLLRDRLVNDYHKYYEDKGTIPLYAKENFIANYNNYHNLGKNGVMDDIKDKMLSLPTDRK